MKHNKKCCVCGDSYYYCTGCVNKSPAYMVSFCCENCRSIYNAVAGFNMGDYTKEEAVELLKQCDLSKQESFSKLMRESIDKILDAPKQEIKSEKREVPHSEKPKK